MQTKTLDEKEIIQLINNKKQETQQIMNIKQEMDKMQTFEEMMQTLKPMDVIDVIKSNQIVQILSSFGTGYTCGSMGKKIGAKLATVVGSAALSIFLLNHLGYVSVNSDKIQKDVAPLVSKGENVFQDSFQRFQKFVQENIAVSVAFGFGVLLS